VVLCGWALIARSAAAQPVDPFALPAETLRLPNGLTVLLAPDPHARLVSVEVDYRTGAADDPDGLRGLAHMVEHIVASRTRHVPDIIRALEEAGACHFNAVTRLDQTRYFESVAPERLMTALWIESDRMGYAADAVTEERVTAQRATLANEGREHNRDGTLAALGPITVHELFPAWHPYAALADGETDVDRIRARDVIAFIQTWYSPANATLAIAGAFDRAKTVEAIARYFGSLPSTPPQARPALPGWVTPAAWLFVHAPMVSERLVLAWRTPAYGEDDDAALDLVASALTGQGNVRLTQALIATHLATGFRARQQSERAASVFWIDIHLEPGADPDRVVRATQGAIDDIAVSLTADELVEARDVWRYATQIAIEVPWGRALLLGSWDRIGDDPGPGFEWGNGRREALDAHRVSAAAGKWLGASHRVVTMVSSDPSAPIRGVLVRRDEVKP
jgi:predicted Zn-dependent peptidase